MGLQVQVYQVVEALVAACNFLVVVVADDCSCSCVVDLGLAVEVEGHGQAELVADLQVVQEEEAHWDLEAVSSTSKP